MGTVKETTAHLASLGIGHRNPGCFVNGSWRGSGRLVTSVNPSNNQVIAEVVEASIDDYKEGAQGCFEASKIWMKVPAPKRGEIVRQIGVALRDNLYDFGKLLSEEMGKIPSEGIGEIQEVIDMCDYAVGLSRQLNGKVVPSERPDHMMMEMWNPLGIVGVITAFNFPCAVLGWNACIALVSKLMEGRCKFHPSHNQLKGVCPFCLRERLSRVKGSSSAPSTMISSASYESSSGASPTTRMRKRRKVKRTKSSLPASSGQTQLRKSRSMASVLGIISSTKSMREGGEDGRGKGRKEVSGKLGFWYKLLGIEKKKKKKMVVKKKIDDEVVSGNKEEIQ